MTGPAYLGRGLFFSSAHRFMGYIWLQSHSFPWNSLGVNMINLSACNNIFVQTNHKQANSFAFNWALFKTHKSLRTLVPLKFVWFVLKSCYSFCHFCKTLLRLRLAEQKTVPFSSYSPLLWYENCFFHSSSRFCNRIYGVLSHNGPLDKSKYCVIMFQDVMTKR